MIFSITIEEICKKLKPIYGKKVDLLYLKYSLTDSREKREEIEQALKVLYEKALNTNLLGEKILLEPPQKNIIEGKYNLGTIEYADKQYFNFGLREQDWIRHVCVTGMSGSGKTNFAFKILQEMINLDKPFIIFEWKKSFRPLIKLNKDIMCFSVGNNNISNLFEININKPPKGVAPKEWVSILCDLITESFFASFGVHKILTETIDKAFRDFGVYKGSGNYPTWYHIKEKIEKKYNELNKRGRESQWLESALRIAYALTFGGFGEAINNKEESFKIEDLLNKKIIFELKALNNSQKKFFCEFLLNYIYLLKKTSEEETNKFKCLILVDEASNIFLKDRPNFIKESVIDKVYREIREYGIGIVCLDQHISKLSDTVVGNSATHIVFQQMLPKDIETVANLMQIRENRKYFTMLPIGYSIVKLAERYFFPFLLKVPYVKLKDTYVSDEEIKNKMNERFRIKKILNTFKKKLKKDLIGEKRVKPKKIKLKNRDKKLIQKYLIENKKSYVFLKYLSKHGDTPTTRVYDSLNLSARKGNQIKKELLNFGLIEQVEERKVNGWKKLLDLSDISRSFIK